MYFTSRSRRKRPVRLTLLIITFLSFALPCWADVVTTTNTEYYSVDGVSRNEIVKNLKKQSPIKQNGKTFYGHTQSKIRYDLSWVRRGKQCTIKKITIHLTITYKYPKLTQRPNTKTMKWWKKNLKGLEEHELIHGKIALDGAKALDRTFKDLKKYDCTNIKSKVKALGKYNLQELRKKQKAYDSLTKHGLKQDRYMGQSF